MHSVYKKSLLIGGLSLSFLAGYCIHRPVSSQISSASTVRKPLYYHDPMHPAYKSAKPGIAPDCGMQLEPVYAEINASEPHADVAPGTVALTPEKERLLGVRTVEVTSGSGVRSIRAVAKIAADESRIDRVSALADGVVRKVSPFSAGSLVHKDDLLATYFVSSRDLFNAMQAFFLSNGTLDQNASTLRNSAILNTTKAEARVEEELLKSYGVTSAQIREMVRTRDVTRDIDFRAPLTGVVLDRNVSPGSVVTKGSELFRIADLSHVWAIADVFESDAEAFRGGGSASVIYAGRGRKAVVTNVRQFDANTRTLKVRLELENPGLELRPDMPVDVVLDSKQPEGLFVPADSVVDEGRRKVVFVASLGKKYEPREVTTGEEFDGRVRILSGLRKGESVVAAGTFLLDAESRMERREDESVAEKLASPASLGEEKRDTMVSSSGKTDPVCGMPLSGVAGDSLLYKGVHYDFCSKTCKQKFQANPAAYPKTTASGKFTDDAGAKS